VTADEVTGLVATAQGRRKLGDNLSERVDPRGRPYFWIGPMRDEAPTRPGTDLRAVIEGKVSLTPIYLDLTHRPALAELKAAFP
ncbi:MAG TPA: 5'/3'-nucleotidase SurE, partial [Stellaceae bacterium]|nr:5'/3'-nucleotidase SurE [Stellaceae bacterium]